MNESASAGHGRRQALIWLGCAAVIGLVAGWFYYRSPTDVRELEWYPDSVEYAVAAHRFATLGRYNIEINGVDYPPRYPPGFSVLVLAPMYALFPDDIGSAIVPILGFAVAGLMLVFAIGYRLGGLWSGMAAAVSVLYLREQTQAARVVMADGPSVTLALLGCVLFLRKRPAASPGTYALAGVLAAFAYSLRTLNLCLAFPFLLMAVLDKNRRAAKLLALMIPCALALVATALYNQATFGDWRRSGYQFWCPVPFDYGLAFSLGYIRQNIRFLAQWAPWWPCALGLVGAIALWRRQAKELGPVLVYMALTAGIISSIHLVYFFSALRFHLLGLVFCCILGGAGLAKLLPRSIERHWWLAPGVLLLPLVWPPQGYTVAPFRYRIAQALSAETPTDAVIISRLDSVYLDYMVVRGTRRRVLPDSRAEEYAGKVVALKKIASPSPPPLHAVDHRAAGLLRGGAREVHAFVASEGVDVIAEWVRKGVPVYVDYLSIPSSSPCRQPLANTFRLVPNARYPWLVRLQLPKGPSEDTAMAAGLDAFYAHRDPAAAVARFREVLELNPTHYGATYQLASALDAAGKPDEARPLWERMLQMAEAAHDQPTAATARARLAATP